MVSFLPQSQFGLWIIFRFHKPNGNMISPLSDYSLYSSDTKYFSHIQCNTSLYITLHVSKIVSLVLTSHPESRNSNWATCFIGFLAKWYPRSNSTSTSTGWRVNESGNLKPSCKKRDEKEWHEKAHPQRVLPAHSLWSVTLGFRESDVWVILPFFNFVLMYLVISTTPWYLCQKKKKFQWANSTSSLVFSKDKPSTCFLYHHVAVT